MFRVIQYNDEKEIEQLANSFINKTLPQGQWTHEAHLTVAIWHLKQHSFYEALCLMRSGIISYNLSVGGTNTSVKGYHETMTVFWMKLIDCFLKLNDEMNLMEACNKFLAGSLAKRDTFFHFYNRETVLSTEARSLFVEPDKIQLNIATVKKMTEQILTSSVN